MLKIQIHFLPLMVLSLISAFQNSFSMVLVTQINRTLCMCNIEGCSFLTVLFFFFKRRTSVIPTLVVMAASAQKQMAPTYVPVWKDTRESTVKVFMCVPCRQWNASLRHVAKEAAYFICILRSLKHP